MPDWTRCRRDLAAFADLGTDLEATEYPQHLQFALTRSGVRLEGAVRGHLESGFSVDLDSHPYQGDYASFLGGSLMANLPRLARQTTLFEGVYRRRSRREVARGSRSISLYDCFVAP